MTHKPQPKEAARQIRTHLAALGIELSQRDALDLVAIVEGHASWQVMHAAQQPPAEPDTRAYRKCWDHVATAAMLHMQRMRNLLAARLPDGYVVKGPEVELEDEYHLALWVEATVPEDAAQPVPVQLLLTLLTDEDFPDRFALRVTLEDMEGGNLCSWTSGTRFNQDFWSADGADLLARLEAFDPESFMELVVHVPRYKDFFVPR